MPEGYLTVQDCARRLSCSDVWIRKEIHAKHLPAEMVGHLWIIKEQDLENYRPNPRGWQKGRPRKAK